MSLNKEKTILFVMPRLPFPMISGRKTSLYHYCRILSEELGFRLVVAAFLEAGDDPNLKPDFIDELVILEKPSKLEKIKNIIFYSFVLSKYPLQVSLYLSASAKRQIFKLVEQEAPAIVIADMVRCTEYIKDVSAFRIADLDDRISLRYKRQLENDIDNVNPYGAFLDTLPDCIKKIALFKPLKIAILKKEIKLLNSYEIFIGKKCEKTIFVAQKEANSFNVEIGENKAMAVPIGVDVEYFMPRQICNKQNIISFLGAMNVAHNEHAAKYFIDRILPLVIEKVPDAKFYVIGGGVSDELKSRKSESIVFTDRVEDVREYLCKSKVFVCPMLFGSGIKTKNLEAMAMGIPVVTTSIGSENIDAVDGKEWLIADTDYEFTEKVISILINDKLNQRISSAARKFVLDRFTWDIAKEQFENILNVNGD